MPLIAQLSDLHLTGMVGQDPSYHQFLACLKLATDHNVDFLLLTGDLVNDGLTAGYDWLFATLQKTGIGFACVAGNHDVTYEHSPHLPFNERTFSPLTLDKRLPKHQSIRLGHWQLLLINSSVAGRPYGTITTETLSWLSDTLDSTTSPTLIALHHPPLSVGSFWIDSHQVTNAAKLWQILAPRPHTKLIICGHVHQAHTLTYAHTTLLTAPAVSRQFMPFCHQFKIHDIPSGIRLIWLNEQTAASKLIRLTANQLKTT